MEFKTPTIGVFDSGFGGLTVLREVIDKVPDAHTIYYADSGRNPYGTRSREEIARFSKQILDFLGGKGIDLAIIACNTATAAAMPVVKDAYEFPVLGVIGSGARSAARTTRNKRIGVLATEYTIKSGAYEEAIAELDPAISVFGHPGQQLVRLVEGGETDGDAARAVVRESLAPFMGAGIDTLVLGCTHFPLLAHMIGEVMGESVTLVNPAQEAAAEARSLLRPRLVPPSSPVSRTFYTSGDVATFRRLGSLFLGREISSAEKVIF